MMKKIFLILMVFFALCIQTIKAEEEMATVRFMSPITASIQATMFNILQFYIDANGKYIGLLGFGQYIDVQVSPGIYNFVLYANMGKFAAYPMTDCTYEKAKQKGWTLNYKNINIEAGKIYYISTIKLKLSNEKAFNKALAKKQIVPGENLALLEKLACPSDKIYTVREGDNLAGIAKKYHVSVAEIAKTNGIKTSTILTIGQTLTLPQGAYLVSNDQVLNSVAEQQSNSNSSQLSIAYNNLTSQIDKNIPLANAKSPNTYVLILANEDYTYMDNVSSASNDGKIFKEYCVKTLGVPAKQIFYYENASFGNIVDGIGKLKYCLDNFAEAKAIVYYCGHGIPDEKTGQAYLIPVDGKGTNMETCYSLNKLYKTLAATKAQSITYFMDACFTGANKEGSMLVAARGVAREPVKETLAGKTVVFSASSGDETAMTLEEQGHGLFTYYLLKKLQETEGNVTYGELADYINKNVKKDAFLINEKPQTPVVATSPAVQNTWRTMKLK